jgi:hypothetical protein
VFEAFGGPGYEGGIVRRHGDLADPSGEALDQSAHTVGRITRGALGRGELPLDKPDPKAELECHLGVGVASSPAPGERASKRLATASVGASLAEKPQDRIDVLGAKRVEVNREPAIGGGREDIV